MFTSEGLLVVYDFASGRRSAQCPELDLWYSEMLRRWPKPNEGVQEVSPATFESSPMHLLAHETFTVSISLKLDEYLSYLMTESNVSVAASSGVAVNEIRSWCEEGLRQFFHGSFSQSSLIPTMPVSANRNDWTLGAPPRKGRRSVPGRTFRLGRGRHDDTRDRFDIQGRSRSVTA